MRLFKNFLLFTYVFLCSNYGNAELVGGHDRQRLSLIFSNQLIEYFENHPITVNSDNFPITLNSDQTEQREKIALFEVLTEEGWLLRTVQSGNVGRGELNIRQVIEYDLKPTLRHEPIIIGSVHLETIQIIQELTTLNHAPESYQVHFEWRLVDEAPWLWAPTLTNFPQMNRYLNAIDRLQTAQATFIWSEESWRLSGLSMN